MRGREAGKGRGGKGEGRGRCVGFGFECCLRGWGMESEGAFAVRIIYKTRRKKKEKSGLLNPLPSSLASRRSSSGGWAEEGKPGDSIHLHYHKAEDRDSYAGEKLAEAPT